MVQASGDVSLDVYGKDPRTIFRANDVVYKSDGPL